MSIAETSPPANIQPEKSVDAVVEVEEDSKSAILRTEGDSDSVAAMLLTDVLGSDYGSMPELTDPEARIWDGCAMTSTERVSVEEFNSWWAGMEQWTELVNEAKLVMIKQKEMAEAAGFELAADCTHGFYGLESPDMGKSSSLL
ncbi:hypothetical protein DFH07DRAFT_1060309 [Mycena maculata]|uniref:Uncharacterized protein n=1 Tax=Mycena maculata TaxID=230809 RepID=A0AAD7JB92_9AGAR|nr:hypothetical protein DFH07DRAFT_1060309 [Mycena maculata]